MHPQGNEERGDALAALFTNIAQHILVVVFGLLPIFFLPLQAAPFSYSKTLFVLVGVFLALIFYGLALLRRGTIGASLNLAPVALWLLALVALVSAFLSGDIRDAIVGDSFSVQSTLFLAFLALSVTVWSILGHNKVAVMRLFILLAFSTLLLSAFHVLRLIFGVDFLAMGVFGGSATLSPFGGWNDLAIFFGLTIILALVAVEQLPLTRPGQVFFSAVVAAALFMLAVINFFSVWVILGLISLVVLIYGLTKDRFSSATSEKKKTPSRMSVGMSFVVLAVSVIFVIGGGTVGSLVSDMTGVSYVEVRPSVEATLDIARNVYAENAIFGVGPNRFTDAWRLHKDEGINQSVFWDTNFNAGFGYIPTLFITLGALGGVVSLLFLAVFIYVGVRTLLKSETADRTWYFISTASFIGGLYIWAMAVVYVPGPALLLLAALCTGLVGVAHRMLVHPTRGYTLNAVGNKRAGVLLVLVFLVLTIGSVSVLYFTGKHYISVYVFNQGLVSLAEGADFEEVKAKSSYAFTLSEDDRFLRQLAEYELVRISNLLALTDPTDEDREAFNAALSNGVKAAESAIAADTTDPRNWRTLGTIYGTLAQSGFEGAYERAVDALETARMYDPYNPSYLLILSQIAYTTGSPEEARAYINDALTLKPNYSDAIFFIAQMDITEGKVDSAIQAARSVTVLEPDNPVRFFQLGLLYFSDRQYQASVNAFTRSLTLSTDYANARYYRALGYDALGKTENAKNDLEIILVSNEGNELILQLLERIEQGLPLVVVAGESSSVADNEGVEERGGSVTTSTPPDTSLVSPVNTIEEEEDQQ